MAETLHLLPRKVLHCLQSHGRHEGTSVQTRHIFLQIPGQNLLKRIFLCQLILTLQEQEYWELKGIQRIQPHIQVLFTEMEKKLR